MKYKIGDRFYFYKNMTNSETIKTGFKGTVDEIIQTSRKTIYCCDGYGFTHDEIKPIISLPALLHS